MKIHHPAGGEGGECRRCVLQTLHVRSTTFVSAGANPMYARSAQRPSHPMRYRSLREDADGLLALAHAVAELEPRAEARDEAHVRTCQGDEQTARRSSRSASVSLRRRLWGTGMPRQPRAGEAGSSSPCRATAAGGEWLDGSAAGRSLVACPSTAVGLLDRACTPSSTGSRRVPSVPTQSAHVTQSAYRVHTS